MKRVLRTVVLGACVAAAVAVGGVHAGGNGNEDGTGHATRAQGPDLGEAVRIAIGGGPTQRNHCEGGFGGTSSGTGDGGGPMALSASALSGAAAPGSALGGTGLGCRNITG
ncbi:hypothetical protein ACH4TX_26475 [Streptomyces sp. NPDC021098]|uniref:hypothetical protein n=1 Tax=unclassified Streptomyces TaxID=2593676 RepID=UPI0037B67977